jgi:hypothetical protein
MSEEAPHYGTEVITPGVVLAVKQPVPLSRVSRYLRGWSKRARTEVRGEYLVVIEPEEME